ncbi:sigma-70 family RNA polymerase sigma factor [Mycolicibacterium moriokaense]|uniref:RNA polymerase sigma-70 factor (ECF subfamily) n=1 Tax=Mycolicibacterium moriokaense TaxID=39691 RepID=A0A318HFZ6_9MYCO|nr:sigma-70 family RNA polymerase sigma factor [Mycolicibacterium moriokaense]PXX08168.1 RNA polymerase sigma-70 factor (ECF subfamily) [Mycolicibacterium moriokaense]
MHGEAFEENRPHLRAVAYRMLGSLTEADDAVQEAWLRLDRADVGDLRNPRGWLTTVVARICLDMLRARSARPEEPLDEAKTIPALDAVDPEQEAVLADSIGVALLVILQTLSPAERLAFVLHDMFDLPFAEIAPIVGRSENTAAQLASRARRRVRGKTPNPAADFARQRLLVEAFLAAARDGDFDGLLTLLDSDVVARADATAAGTPTTISGAQAVAASARAFSANSRFAEPALVDGAVGIVVAPKGKLALVLRFSVAGDKITEIDIEADPARLSSLSLALLD